MKSYLAKIGELMQPIVSGISHLKTEVSHLKTAVDALKAGQDDIRDKMATKPDIKQLEQKIDETAKDHEERIEQLELAHHKN
jgi:chromosome segregation ATPase